MVFQTGEQGQQCHGANERKTAAAGVAGSTRVGVRDEEEGNVEQTEEESAETATATTLSSPSRLLEGDFCKICYLELIFFE